MAKWKNPQSLEFVTGATERFSFPNWQSGNDDSVYYNLNIPSFFGVRVVMPSDEYSVLERNIQPDLLDLTFTAPDGTITPPLKDFLVGPKQVQAMMMAHKGNVIFETYPGMNPTDIHVWMSASKITAGLLIAMLVDKGKIDAEKTQELMDLRLFNEDGSFEENGGSTKPTKQDADLTNYQMVTDLSRRQIWLKIPVPDYFADWTHFDLEELWA